jgi:thiamine-phosphate pyrophosphorylase
MEVARVAAEYADIIWFRIKNEPDRDIYEQALTLRRALPDTRLILSARADIAHAAGFDGVQLNASSLPPEAVKGQFPQLIAGYSAHSVEECGSLNADYYTLSPIFTSHKTQGRQPLGPIPAPAANVYALGGVKLANVGELDGLGYAGVAGISLYEELPELAKITM